MFVAALDTGTADNTILVVVYHERMPEHRAAAFIRHAGIAGVVLAAVQAEMSI